MYPFLTTAVWLKSPDLKTNPQMGKEILPYIDFPCYFAVNIIALKISVNSSSPEIHFRNIQTLVFWLTKNTLFF